MQSVLFLGVFLRTLRVASERDKLAITSHFALAFFIASHKAGPIVLSSRKARLTFASLAS